MTTYYTTSVSNLAGLSARAYGSSMFFRETKNQIIARSLYTDLYRSRPSQLFSSIFPSTNALVSVLAPVLETDLELKRFLLVNPDPDFLHKFANNLHNILDTHSHYDLGLAELFAQALGNYRLDHTRVAKLFLQQLKEHGVYYAKLEAFYNIARNNHFSKISDVPDNSILKISNLQTDMSWNGVEMSSVEIPPQKYYSGDIYRSSAIEKDYSKLSQNYHNYLGAHVTQPDLYNGYDSVNYPEPVTPAGSDVLNITLVNVKKGIYV